MAYFLTSIWYIFSLALTQVNPAVFNALNETEKQVLTSIQEWGSLLEVEEKRTSRMTKKIKDQASDQDINIEEISIKIIEKTLVNLEELRNEIKKQQISQHPNTH